MSTFHIFKWSGESGVELVRSVPLQEQPDPGDYPHVLVCETTIKDATVGTYFDPLGSSSGALFRTYTTNAGDLDGEDYETNEESEADQHHQDVVDELRWAAGLGAGSVSIGEVTLIDGGES